MKNKLEEDNKKLSPDKHIRWLDKKMNKCSEKENYEEAAEIRDIVNKLKPLAIRYESVTNKLKEIVDKEEYEIASSLKAEIAKIKIEAGDIVTTYEKRILPNPE
jgi:protein-arginine kinase activator protein McsA